MTREEAIAKMNATSAKYDRIGSLRRKAEELLLASIPKDNWEDGQLFVLDAKIYDQVRAWLDEAYLLEGYTHRQIMFMTILEYIGPNGTLKIYRGASEL